MDRIHRKMLRRIIGWRCLDGEPWEKTMKRMNEKMESAILQYAMVRKVRPRKMEARGTRGSIRRTNLGR